MSRMSLAFLLFLSLAASLAGQTAQGRTGSSAESKTASPTKLVKGYSIILLIGESQGSSMPQNLPGPARAERRALSRDEPHISIQEG